LRSGHAFEIFAHDFFADGGMSGENREIQCSGKFAASLHPVLDGPGRVSVRTLHGSGDALGDLRFGERIAVELLEGVVVNVDKSGSEDETVSIDDAFAGSGNQFANGSDAIAADAQGAARKWSSGTVGEKGVDD